MERYLLLDFCLQKYGRGSPEFLKQHKALFRGNFAVALNVVMVGLLITLLTLPICQQNSPSEPSCELHLSCQTVPRATSSSPANRSVCMSFKWAPKNRLKSKRISAEKNLTSYFHFLTKNLLKGSNSRLSLMNLINPWS